MLTARPSPGGVRRATLQHHPDALRNDFLLALTRVCRHSAYRLCKGPLCSVVPARIVHVFANTHSWVRVATLTLNAVETTGLRALVPCASVALHRNGAILAMLAEKRVGEMHSGGGQTNIAWQRATARA